MRVTGKDALFFVLAVGAGYALYKVFSGSAALGKGLSKLWEGVTFDPTSLGPGAALTQGAQLSQQDYVNRDYMAFDAAGNSYITDLGKKFIARADELQRQYVQAGYDQNTAMQVARAAADAEFSGMGLAGFGRVVEGERVA